MTRNLTDALASTTHEEARTRARANLLELLLAQAQRYTQGESTSLPRETMDELLASLCYTLGIDPKIITRASGVKSGSKLLQIIRARCQRPPPGPCGS